MGKRLAVVGLLALLCHCAKTYGDDLGAPVVDAGTAPAPAPSGPFTLSAASDVVAVVSATTAVPVTIGRGAVVDAVVVTVAALPAGVTVAPLTIAPGETLGQLQITVAATAALAVTPIAITAASGAVTASQDVTLEVRPPAGSFDTSFGTAGLVRPGTSVSYPAVDLANFPDAYTLLVNTSSGAATVEVGADGASQIGPIPNALSRGTAIAAISPHTMVLGGVDAANRVALLQLERDSANEGALSFPLGPNVTGEAVRSIVPRSNGGYAALYASGLTVGAFLADAGFDPTFGEGGIVDPYPGARPISMSAFGDGFLAFAIGGGGLNYRLVELAGDGGVKQSLVAPGHPPPNDAGTPTHGGASASIGYFPAYADGGDVQLLFATDADAGARPFAVTTLPTATVVQADGKQLYAFLVASGVEVRRFGADGTEDPSFHVVSIPFTGATAARIYLQADRLVGFAAAPNGTTLFRVWL